MPLCIDTYIMTLNAITDRTLNEPAKALLHHYSDSLKTRYRPGTDTAQTRHRPVADTKDIAESIICHRQL